MTDAQLPETDELVPDAVIPHKNLPALKYRDLPEPIPWTKMVGPSIMLAGLALGSGEFILWPYITYKAGFIFFWACMLGVLTQFFINMEIERWTLATGESAITGFCRLWKPWGFVMLACNIIPWAWPGWATGAGNLMSWIIFGPVEKTVTSGDAVKIVYEAKYASWFGVAGLLLVGIVLTAGPVVYNTVEKIQKFLVGLILVLVVLISILVVRPDAVREMLMGMASIGTLPPESSGLTIFLLLGALAFAGAGGSTNLGQSNFIKDKGYGMGKYIGRITSPITGNEEATIEIGYHFKHTPENMRRWGEWWKAANIEHVFSFLFTCIVCLCLMSLITYSLTRDGNGNMREGMEQFGGGLNFVWAQATVLEGYALGGILKLGFLVMGVAILLTTELGVLDAVARISTDIVKVNFLLSNDRWTLSRLYYCFLWGEILLGVAIIAVLGMDEPLLQLLISASLNGAVMFIYSLILLYMNSKVLSRSLSLGPVRFVAMVWAAAFFGYFCVQALRLEVIPRLQSLLHFM